nr:unnamed protein product [Digitaria exilis]
MRGELDVDLVTWSQSGEAGRGVGLQPRCGEVGHTAAPPHQPLYELEIPSASSSPPAFSSVSTATSSPGHTTAPGTPLPTSAHPTGHGGAPARAPRPRWTSGEQIERIEQSTSISHLRRALVSSPCLLLGCFSLF